MTFTTTENDVEYDVYRRLLMDAEMGKMNDILRQIRECHPSLVIYPEKILDLIGETIYCVRVLLFDVNRRDYPDRWKFVTRAHSGIVTDVLRTIGDDPPVSMLSYEDIIEHSKFSENKTPCVRIELSGSFRTFNPLVINYDGNKIKTSFEFIFADRLDYDLFFKNIDDFVQGSTFKKMFHV